MTMTPEQIASAWALVNAATQGRPVQYHPNYCPEAKDAKCAEWDTSHDLSVIRADGSRYRIGTFHHAHDAMFDQAARELVPQLLTALDAERAKVARLVNSIKNIDANLDHFLARTPKQMMHPETVEFLRGMNIAPLTEIKETDHE